MIRLLLAVALVLLPIRALAVGPEDVVLVEDTDGSIHQSYFFGNVYMQKVACRFYQTHPDDYDVIFAFTTLNPGLMSTIEGWPVIQDQQGIGRKPYNHTVQYCSYDNRLRQALKLGFIGAFPDAPNDPDEHYILSVLTGMEMVAHEFAHHWLASVKYDLDDGTGLHCRLRGLTTDSVDGMGTQCDGTYEEHFNWHWSKYFDQGSVMYSNSIEDLGNGKFKLYNDGLKYGPLDQYLMGLRAPEEVGPMFVVDPGYLATESSGGPMAPGKTQTINGTRIDLTVEDIIRAEGPRVPAFDQCHWKGALVIVHPPGQLPTAAQIQKVALYGGEFEEFYEWATDGRGSMDMSLDNSGAGTVGCPGEPSVIKPDDPFPDLASPDAGAPEVAEDVNQSPEAWVPETGPLDLPVVSDLGTPDTVAGDGGSLELPEQGTLCVPGALSCSWDRDWVQRCNPSGTAWENEEDCGAQGRVCDVGWCVQIHGGDGSGSSCAAGPRPHLPTLLLFGLLLFLPLQRRFGNL